MQEFDHLSPIPKLQDYLRSQEWLMAGELLKEVGKAGDGNMNVVLRIKTNRRSFVLKQSRPYVQKYQQIAAPLTRINVEHRFYEAVQNSDLARHLPGVLGYDRQNYILLLEDLGNCEDMTSIYESRSISTQNLVKLGLILKLIHGTSPPAQFPENLEMRHLNHQHIFVLPFLEDNGFQLNDIQLGLQELSEPYKRDTKLKEIVGEIGNRYLLPGDTLLHGDYYPGSWMTNSGNIHVIDPEFGFVGFAEFDLGVMVAHLIMATHDEAYLDTVLDNYEGSVDKKLTSQVAGIEIIRRLIGLAQLPIKRTIKEKDSLLRMARKMILL